MNIYLCLIIIILFYSPFLIHSPSVKKDLYDGLLPYAQWADKQLIHNFAIDSESLVGLFNNRINLIREIVFPNHKISKLKEEIIEVASKDSIWESLKKTFNNMLTKLKNERDDTQFDSQGLILPDLNSTCKHNFASLSGGASIVKAPKEADGANNLLSGSRDKYMIVPCSTKKSFVISLSEDAIISKFMILSAQEYSSTIELFNLYGSDSYDSEHQSWDKLGSFMASDQYNGIWQSFNVNPSWVRYLKFEWKTSLGMYNY